MGDNGILGVTPVWTQEAWSAGLIKVNTKHCKTQKYISSRPHGSTAEDLFVFFPIVGLWELMSPGCGQFGPQGYHWQDLCRVPLIATYLIYKL